MLQMRVGQREFDGFVVVSGFNSVIAAQDFLGLAIWTVGGARLAVLGADDAAHVLGQALAVFGEGLFRPGHVLLDRLLHLFRTHGPK
jgi:hypothetical protein